ncbi:MAG: hypothetical protein PHU25_20380 [Deltaproteobacteria bacterium]|nr:hypothetical protein [Deltaproteobacteria bacterium]
MKRIDASPEGIFDVSWSPDGRWLAYVRGGTEVCIANVETGEIRVVGPGAYPNLTSDMSVVLERDDQILRVQGAGAQTLVSTDGIVRGTPKHAPLVSPDGALVLLHVSNVFDKWSQARNAYPYRHFMAIAPLGAGKPVLTAEQWYGGSTVWFPDSRRFAHYEFDSTGGARIHVVSAEGVHQGTMAGLFPSVSPDGARIAAKPRGGGNVVVYSSRGSWANEEVETAVLKLPESTGRLSATPPMWLDNRLVVIDEGDKMWRVDIKKDKAEEMHQLPAPTLRGRHTMALSPERERIALEVAVDGGFALGVVKLC